MLNVKVKRERITRISPTLLPYVPVRTLQLRPICRPSASQVVLRYLFEIDRNETPGD
ncbi:MAG: hypothetical protein WD049_06540 [Candidatus Paceibacterota bacterium]